MNETVDREALNTREIPHVVEPLAQLARFAFDWAPTLCDPAHGCMPYHRFWSMMRLIDMDSMPPKGIEFFTRAFATLQTGGHTPRILLAGAADTGLTALVLNAARANGLEPVIVLADRCETTMRQNELFARAQGFRLETHHGNLGAIDCEPVDAFVSHNVLNFFPIAERAAALAAIASYLRPGGRMISLQGVGEGARQVDGTRVASDRARLEQKLRDHGEPEFRIREIGDAAEVFWSKRLTHGPTPEAVLREAIDQAGLSLVSLEQGDMEHRTSPLSLDGQKSARPHALIVAERPA